MTLPPPFSKSSALSRQRLAVLPDSSQNVSNETIQCTSKGTSTQFLSYIPDEPSISLSKTAVNDFLVSELSTPVLDELYNHLWFVARRSGRSIDPLHRQKIKGRSVIATEDAGLHLVWHHDMIYIKPMPLCLLNYDFWAQFLSTSANREELREGSIVAPKSPHATIFDRATAIGFMRSYSLLVRHRVDFVYARESHLFPVETDWIKWSKFINTFRKVEDEGVSNRYHYGQLRLSRLNWAVRLFRPSSAATKWFYEIPHWSTGMFVERAITPLFFGFASLSLVLSSMQVLLSVPDKGLKLYIVSDLSFIYMRRAFWVFSIFVLLLSGAVWASLFVIPFGVFIWQLLWGFRNRNKPCAHVKGSRGQEGVLNVGSKC